MNAIIEGPPDETHDFVWACRIIGVWQFVRARSVRRHWKDYIAWLPEEAIPLFIPTPSNKRGGHSKPVSLTTLERDMMRDPDPNNDL